MSAHTKFGFRDLRTPAELILAPAQPAARTISAPSTVRTSNTFGSIASAAKMPSAVFSGMRAALAAKATLQRLSTSLNGTISTFDAQSKSLLSGASTTRDTNVFGVSSLADGEFFSAADMVQFSSLRPGQSLAQSQVHAVQLAQRKRQLLSITTRLTVLLSNFSVFGARVQENYNRSPYPLPEDVDRPSIPRLAQGSAAAATDPILRDKRRFVVTGAPIAAAKPSFWVRLVTNLSDPLKSYKKLPGYNPLLNMSFADKANQSGWSEPPTPYAAQFPYNKVQQTESGHVFELDDTPGAERVHIFHRSGSFIEMHPDGKVVYKSMSHGYLISMADQNVKVRGNCNISVDGDANIHARGQVNVQSDSDVNINTKQDFNVYATNINLRAKKKATLDGITVDLRYAQLPGVPVFTINGPAVRLIPAALQRDFPEVATKMNIADATMKGAISSLKSTILTTALPRLMSSAAGMSSFAPSIGAMGMAAQIQQQAKSTLQIIELMQKGLQGVPPFVYPKLSASQTPKENPLGNPLVYYSKTAAAVTYRTFMFDTPDEVGDAEHYQAHLDTRKVLGDIPTHQGPSLGGVLTTHDTGIVPRHRHCQTI